LLIIYFLGFLLKNFQKALQKDYLGRELLWKGFFKHYFGTN